MKTARPPRRSVSPFGLKSPEPDPFEGFRESLERLAPPEEDAAPLSLASFADVGHLPAVLKGIWDSPANDSPQLKPVCEFLLRYNVDIGDHGLFEAVYLSMEEVFRRKTDLFLIDHHDEEYCQRMGWPETYRDDVLFARERDLLVGFYFAPVTRNSPGRFSEFVRRWVGTTSFDRLLHFFDFCKNAQDPTSDHFLLFTHPAFARLLRDRALLRGLFENARRVIKRVGSPTWEADIRKALEL
ncbi:MAG: hypothetical protein LHV69_04580 [Elusimicrobia bacterium]|nr:hypothetical protein [Candidatus Obscuribacterium magneticum]